jgi:hypothetical protein
MNSFAKDAHTLVCKHLAELPPVVTDWQQSCQQPRCPHYCQGDCCNPGRHWASAACPFDGKELLLEDATIVHDSPSLTIPGVSSKAQPSAPDEIAHGHCFGAV